MDHFSLCPYFWWFPSIRWAGRGYIRVGCPRPAISWYARLTIIYRHRVVLLSGMTFFALFSLVCAVSPSFVGLVVARAFQGIGAALTIPSAQAHIALHFTKPAEKAKALGIWGAAGSLGFIVGLILGGVLTASIGWRWIFWISLIISGIIIPAAYVVLPRVHTSRVAIPLRTDSESIGHPQPISKKKLLQSVQEGLVRFDALGISLGIPGILLLALALTSANSEGWQDPKIIATLVVSVVLLVIFVLHERSASQAILAPHLFRNRSFNFTLVLAVNTYAVRQACTYFLTLQLQSYGASPIHTSILFIPLGISALIFNTLSGRLVPILGAQTMVGRLCISSIYMHFLIEALVYHRLDLFHPWHLTVQFHH
jgi:MFS family permease